MISLTLLKILKPVWRELGSGAQVTVISVEDEAIACRLITGLGTATRRQVTLYFLETRTALIQNSYAQNLNTDLSLSLGYFLRLLMKHFNHQSAFVKDKAIHQVRTSCLKFVKTVSSFGQHKMWTQHRFLPRNSTDRCWQSPE